MTENASQPHVPAPKKMGIFTKTMIWVLAITGACTMLQQCVELMSYKSRYHRESPSVVQQAKAPGAQSTPEYTYRLGAPDRIAGSDAAILRLSRYGNSGFISKGYNSTTVNYLFLNLADGAGEWLWKAPLPLVVDEKRLQEKSPPNQQRPNTALLLTLVEKDTNNDKYLDGTDQKSLVAINTVTRKFTPILDGFGEIQSMTDIEGDKIFIVFDKQGDTWSATLDLKNFTLHNEKKLPALTLP